MHEISSHNLSKISLALRTLALGAVVISVSGCASSEAPPPPPAAGSPTTGAQTGGSQGGECEVASDCEAAAIEVGFNLGCTQVQCVSGSCSYQANEVDGASCDDGDACTDGDTCSQRYCEGVAKVCEDGDPCTTDTCAPESGECVFPVAEGAPCDDELACTAADTCDVNGLCIGEPTETCQCLTDDDCLGLSDEDRCQGVFTCRADYTCEFDPTTKVVCDPSLSDDCNAAACVPETGECAVTPRNESAPCTATDNPCIDTGICVIGVCEGPEISCDDGDPCTSDFCVSALGGCQHDVIVGETCDDGDICTADDTCLSDGSCFGAPVSCVDGNPCTVGSCDPSSGNCAFMPVDGDCIDDDPCSVAETCVEGQCVGEPMDCDDGKVCTEDLCKVTENLGYCANTPVADETPCDLGDVCTEQDFCLSGECIGGLTLCDCEVDSDCAVFEDPDPCTPTFGCASDVFPKVCEPDLNSVPQCSDSGVPCVLNTCQSDTGECGLEPADNMTPCDDGDPCSVDGVCLSGLCTSQPLDCEDGDPCTSNLCDAGDCLVAELTGGAVLVTVDFEAGIPSDWSTTTDADQAGWMLVAPDPSVNAGQSLGSMGAEGAYPGPASVSFTSANRPLYGQSITLRYAVKADLEEPGCGADVLQVGVSSFGVFTPLSLICESTDGWVDVEVDLSDYRNQSPQIEFRFVSNGFSNAGAGVAIDDISITASFACVDDDACTVNEVCVQGQCSTEGLSCDDGDGCTADSCDPDLGCVHTPLEACACAVVADCPEPGPCLVAACENGSCVATPDDDQECDDDNACTMSDSCSAGSCVGLEIACDDAQACTTDSCNPEVGCVFTPLEGECDDDDPCTSSDQCVEGICQGQPLVCDTGNPCAEGTCVVVNGEGTCETTFLHDGQMLTGDTFDGLAPGQLPASWVQYADISTVTWATEPGTSVSAPTALAVTGLEAGVPATTTVEAAQHVLPSAGGHLAFNVNMAGLSDPSCESDMLIVRIDELVVAEVCDSTDGWAAVEVNLDAYIGLVATLSFEFTYGGEGDIAPTIHLDDVALTATYQCPQAATCTTGICVLGTCVPEPIPDCN